MSDSVRRAGDPLQVKTDIEIGVDYAVPEPVPCPPLTLTKMTEITRRMLEEISRMPVEWVLTGRWPNQQIPGCPCPMCQRERNRPGHEDRYRGSRVPDDYESYSAKLDRLDRAARAIGYELRFDPGNQPILVKITEKKPFKYSKPHPLDAGIVYEDTNHAE